MKPKPLDIAIPTTSNNSKSIEGRASSVPITELTFTTKSKVESTMLSPLEYIEKKKTNKVSVAATDTLSPIDANDIRNSQACEQPISKSSGCLE